MYVQEKSNEVMTSASTYLYKMSNITENID